MRGERAALLGREARCWRLLDHLLVTPLHRAVALEQVHDLAVPVAEDLRLDMPWSRQIALQKDPIVAERRCRLALRTFERGREAGRLGDHPHAPAATTGRSLDQHREAQCLRRLEERAFFLAGAVVARDQRHACLGHQGLGAILGAHRLDHRRRRPDEGEPGLAAGTRERRVLGEEAIARMDRLGAGACRSLDDRIDAKVAFRGRRRADAHRLVRERDMARQPVGIRPDGDRADAKAPQRADDPTGDLAPIGHQHGSEHALSRSSRACASPGTRSGPRAPPASRAAPRSGAPSRRSAPGRSAGRRGRAPAAWRRRSRAGRP